MVCAYPMRLCVRFLPLDQLFRWKFGGTDCNVAPHYSCAKCSSTGPCRTKPTKEPHSSLTRATKYWAQNRCLGEAVFQVTSDQYVGFFSHFVLAFSPWHHPFKLAIRPRPYSFLEPTHLPLPGEERHPHRARAFMTQQLVLHHSDCAELVGWYLRGTVSLHSECLSPCPVPIMRI